MRTRRDKSWRRRAGATLVEALAGMVLLGTLLVAMLVAKGRLTIQAQRAENRLQACQVLDGLLEGWWPDRKALPRSDTGGVPERPGWRWRTQIVESQSADAMRAQVVAVEVFAPNTRDRLPAARVEILLPLEDKPQDKADANGEAGNATNRPDAR